MFDAYSRKVVRSGQNDVQLTWDEMLQVSHAVDVENTYEWICREIEDGLFVDHPTLHEQMTFSPAWIYALAESVVELQNEKDESVTVPELYELAERCVISVE